MKRCRGLRPAAFVVMLAGCASSAAVIVDYDPVPTTVASTTDATPPDELTNPPRPEDPAARSAFDAARAKWDAARLRDYSFRVRFSCFCPMYGPWDVVVRNRVVVSTTPVDATQQVAPVDGFRSIDDLLGQVDRAVAEAGSVVVRYDPGLGYPSSVSIDWITGAVDDDLNWEITSLSVG